MSQTPRVIYIWRNITNSVNHHRPSLPSWKRSHLFSSSPSRSHSCSPSPAGDTTQFYAWRDSVALVRWFVYMCDNARVFMWRESVTWLVYMYYTTQFYAWRDSVIRVTWLVYMCDMARVFDVLCDLTQLYVWRDSFMCVTQLSSTRDVTQLYLWRDSLKCKT